MGFFIDPAGVNNEQLAFLTAVYGVVLYQASNLVSSGSELLLLIHEVAGIVGSIILPILGAVPDGMMVLFSGLGPNAQEEVSVGVGALAGSTAMLLTIPWFIAVFYGRVPLGKDGTPQYGGAAAGGGEGSGIEFKKSIQTTTTIMVATTFLYMVIQVPASVSEMMGASTLAQSKTENLWAFVALVLSIAAFLFYLWKCYTEAPEDKQLEMVIRGIKNQEIGLPVALNYMKASATAGTAKEKLNDDENKKRLRRITKPFFNLLDADDSESLELEEFKHLLKMLGIRGRDREEFKKANRGKGKVDLKQFVEYLHGFLKTQQPVLMTQMSETSRLMTDLSKRGDDDDEAEEVPEDLMNLGPREQKRRILLRSFSMMGAGLALVLIFTDPTVDVLSEWGKRLGVPPFYVSFILAPFASNASELLSAYAYASKKSSGSITTSLSTLIGAACMNNTFCFAIFMALVWLKGLAWQFTAETIAIVASQWVIALIVFKSRKQTIYDAFLILSVYPASLFLVWFLENIVGWD